MGVNTVIAVYPNAIGFGYAIVQNEVLKPVDCGVVSISPTSNVACVERIGTLMEQHGITLVVVQNLTGKHSFKSNRVAELIEGIQLLAVTRGVRVFRYSREQIKFVFEQFKAKSKHQIATAIVEAMPQYKFRLPPKRKSWKPEHYNMGMFDALSLILTHFWINE